MDPMSTPNRPLSVKEISEQAENFTWNANISLKHWIRAADTLYREGEAYEREENYSKAYLLLLRHSSLVIGYLSTHPQAKQPEGKKALKPIFARIPRVVQELERIKPLVDASYQEWAKFKALQDAEKASLSEARRSSYDEHAARDAALSWNARVQAQLLDAGENQGLAVDLAKKEIRKRDAARKSTRRAGISEEEEAERRKAVYLQTPDLAGSNGFAEENEQIQRQMEATRQRLDRYDAQSEYVHDRITNAHTADSRPSAFPLTNSAYHYPSISRSSPFEYEHPPERTHKPLEVQRPQPPRPPKETPYRHTPPPSYDAMAPPVRPEKQPLHSYHERAVGEARLAAPNPPPKIMDRGAAISERKQRVTFKPSAYLENGSPLRTVFLPSGLRRTFLDIAASNTATGLEMCGILCGTLVNNALFISCLLIPEQKCTPDTCETENESAMLDYCINEDLLMVGWIHTHPTQTCFMSSRDLHTQAGYQVMMAESIAIVCAPRYKDFGIYRLTNPPGLPHILQCAHTDTFHQHTIDGIYTGAGNPAGHVYETSELDFQVTDLRPSR